MNNFPLTMEKLEQVLSRAGDLRVAVVGDSGDRRGCLSGQPGGRLARRRWHGDQ